MIWTGRFWCWGSGAVSTVLNAMYYIPLIIIVFSERGPEKADYEAAGLRTRLCQRRESL